MPSNHDQTQLHEHQDTLLVSSPDTKNAPKQPTSKQRMLMMMVLLSLLLSFGLITYVYQLLHRTQIQQTRDLAHVYASLQHMTESNQKLSAQLLQSQHQIQTLLKEQGYQSNDWLIQKARYYLDLAQINANWTDHKPITMALLTQADLVFSKMNDTRFEVVRQAITQDLVTLKQLSSVDVNNLLAKLQMIQKQVDLLQPISVYPQTSSIPAATETLDTSWRARLNDSMKQLQHLVVIHHNDNYALVAQLTPTYRTLVHEQIRLLIQEAQLAVLAHNQNLYVFSLDTAIHALRRYFKNALTLVNELQNLKKQTITNEQPRSIQSLVLLDSLTQAPVIVRNPPATETTE